MTATPRIKPRACQHGDPPCRRCVNSRNRSRGLAKQRAVFDLLGMKVQYRGQRSQEEQWPESPKMPGVRWEVKSGIMPAVVRRALDQLQAQRAFGSTFVPAVAIVPEGEQRAYAVVDLEKLVSYCEALAEVGSGSKIRSLIRDGRRVLDLIEEAAR